LAECDSTGFGTKFGLQRFEAKVAAAAKVRSGVLARQMQNEGMRKVLKSELRPLEIKPQEKSVWICMCGLSKNQPFCDGSHKTIGEEETGKVYEYDDQGHRVEVR
jgi:CDGSH-type Zn-finger protein